MVALYCFSLTIWKSISSNLLPFLFWCRLGHESDLCEFWKVLVMKQPYFYVPQVGAELQGLWQYILLLLL